ncbi:MAG: murein biosynthesis integral membrane protein MurJ, partial [Spirochaetes bacterium]|nr:murein biosynthesis integral membrane protein MurJ [Spirochaetota bacterium]
MKKSLIKSTGIVVITTAVSRMLGFVRDMVIAGMFGATASMDGFWVAFRIPNLFRRLVAEGSLTITFVPVYTEYLINRGEKEALSLAQKTFSILVIALTLIILLGEIFSHELIALFGYGFTNPAQIELTVMLNRIMFFYLFFVCMVAFA